MSKISQIPVKSVVDGSEYVPIYNSEPSNAYPADNYRVKLSAMAAFFGASLSLFAAVVNERSGDVISGTSSEEGDIVYLANSGVFAKRVTLGEDELASTKYYTQFTDPNCHSGEPQAGKLYVCADPFALYARGGTQFLQLTIPTEWMTEEEFEDADLKEGVTYITFEEEG